MKPYNRFLFYWLPVFIYCLLIYIQSSRPFFSVFPKIDHIDKVFHFLAYSVLGALFYRALGQVYTDNRIGGRVLLAFTFSSLYGMSDEIHQHFVPGRTADIIDVIADMLGSLSGAYIYRTFLHRYHAVSRNPL